MRGVWEIGGEIEFVAELPRPNGRRLLEACDDFARVVTHEFGGATRGVAPLVQRFADEIGDRCLMPEEGRNQADAMLLSDAHDGGKAGEIFGTIGLIKRPVDRPVAARSEPREGNAVGRKHVKWGLDVSGWFRAQGADEGVVVIHADAAERFAAKPQYPVAVDGEARSFSGDS